MSFGLMSAIALGTSNPSFPSEDSVFSLETGTPSITNSGWLSPYTELAPQSTIRDQEPTAPELPVIFTPETFPDNEFTRFIS